MDSRFNHEPIHFGTAFLQLHVSLLSSTIFTWYINPLALLWKGAFYTWFVDENIQQQASGGSRPCAKGGGPVFFKMLNQNWFANIACPAGFSSFYAFSLFYFIFCQNKGGPRAPPLDPPLQATQNFLSPFSFLWRARGPCSNLLVGETTKAWTCCQYNEFKSTLRFGLLLINLLVI